MTTYTIDLDRVLILEDSDFDISKGYSSAVVLEEDMALLGLAEFVAILEFALCHCGAERRASSHIFQDLNAVEIVPDLLAYTDDSNRVPLARRIGLSAFCRNEVIQIGQCVWPFDFGVRVVKLVLEAEFCVRVGEVLYTAVDCFSIGVEFVVEPEIEVAVLLFRDDART